MNSSPFNGNVVTLTYTVKIGLTKQYFWNDASWRPNWAIFRLFLGHFSEFLDGTIRDMQFVVNTAPSCLIPMLDAIDKHMLDRENRNDFEILKLQADSPNCTFSTWNKSPDNKQFLRKFLFIFSLEFCG